MRSYLSSKCSSYDSLKYFHSNFISLKHPHPLFSFLQGNAYEIYAALIQARILCGSYRTEKLRRHWSKNKLGLCLFPECFSLKQMEDIKHFLIHFNRLNEARRRLVSVARNFSIDKPVFKLIIDEHLFSPDEDLQLQFLIDPSVLPKVIAVVQYFGVIILQNCFKISRMWCRLLHVARLRMIGKENL